MTPDRQTNFGIRYLQNKSRIIILLSIIIATGIVLRLYYFPYESELILDGLHYFIYASTINLLEGLPNEWTPANNGWPIFLSFWFSIINLENSFEYMQLQRIISLALSSLTAIPIYFLCRKFFDEKLALLGSAFFVFDPRIILNSLLGLSEPLFILLGTTSLILFLKYGRKEIILAFVFVSFATIVRSEGLLLMLALSVMFLIKYKISKEIVKTYLPALMVFLLILTPIMIYKIEVSGNDALFQRAAGGVDRVFTIYQENNNEILEGGVLFIKYLGWIMIPSFLFFIPFGTIQFLRKRTQETNFIIIFLISCSIPILYAYILQISDHRFLYPLYPIFCLISLFAVKTYVSKFSKKNLIILIIILLFLLSSIFFYEYKIASSYNDLFPPAGSVQ